MRKLVTIPNPLLLLDVNKGKSSTRAWQVSNTRTSEVPVSMYIHMAATRIKISLLARSSEGLYELEQSLNKA
jgi:hypothetical protein